MIWHVKSQGTALSLDLLVCPFCSSPVLIQSTDTFRLKDHQDVEIPETGVICCTPVLLMSTGAVWKLERCNCHPPELTADGYPTTECDAGQLLWGFHKFKYVQMLHFWLEVIGRYFSHHATPTTPVECCDVCLGPYYYDTSQCTHLNSCNSALNTS